MHFRREYAVTGVSLSVDAGLDEWVRVEHF